MALYVNGKKVAGVGMPGKDGKSAYQLAVEGGYQGTEEEFSQMLASGGLPSGGTTGQMLYQGENGAEWGDKPVMYVTITGDEESGYSADKTCDELIAAYNDGYALFAVIYVQNQPSNIASLYIVTDIPGVKNVQFCGVLGSPFVFIYEEPTTEVMVIFDNKISASRISFTPGATGLTATNVQDAIEEVNGKAFPATGGAITGDVILGSEGQDVSNAPKIKSPDGTVFAHFIGNGMFQIDSVVDGIVGSNIRIGDGASISMIAASDTDTDLQSSIEISDVALWFKAGRNGIEFISRGGITFSAVDGIVFDTRPSVPPPEIDEHAANKAYVDSKAPKYRTVTLTAAGWSSNVQTVTVSGVLADETAQLIQPMPAIASQAAYYAAGILCTNQAANSLTFTCQTVPTEDLTVYVVIQEVTV